MAKEVAILAAGVLLIVLVLRVAFPEEKTTNEELKELTLSYQEVLFRSVDMIKESEENYFDLLADYMECKGIHKDSIEVEINRLKE